jgi:hypothetical protein
VTLPPNAHLPKPVCSLGLPELLLPLPFTCAVSLEAHSLPLMVVH